MLIQIVLQLNWLLVLKPLHDVFKIKRVVVSTYQSVSGGGKAPMDELIEQTKLFLDKEIKFLKILLNKLLLMLFLISMFLQTMGILKKNLR